MKNAKHTPGPWFAHKQYVTDKLTFGFDDRGARIGETPNWHISAPSPADAQLIAAAPDMLEALNACLNAMNHMGDILNGMDAVSKEDEHCFAAFDSARKAIAKATGGSDVR